MASKNPVLVIPYFCSIFQYSHSLAIPYFDPSSTTQKYLFNPGARGAVKNFKYLFMTTRFCLISVDQDTNLLGNDFLQFCICGIPYCRNSQYWYSLFFENFQYWLKPFLIYQFLIQHIDCKLLTT